MLHDRAPDTSGAGRPPEDQAGRDLGAKIRRRRKELGLTQADLGGSRLSKGYISLVESGKVVPSEEALDYLASRLGRPVSHFRTGASDLAAVMRNHLATGVAFIRQGDHAAAAESLRQAAKMALLSADAHELALVHETAGHLYLVQGDVAAAEFAYREALSLYREVGANEPAANCNCHLLNCALVRDRTELAESEFAAAITQLESDRLPDPLIQGRAWLGGGLVALARGLYHQAQHRLDSAAAAFGGQDLAGAGETQLALGLLASAQADWPASRIHLERAVALLDSVADPRVVAIGMRHLLGSLVEVGELDRAAATVDRLGAIYGGLGDDHWLTWAAITLADLSLRMGDPGTARRAAGEAGAMLTTMMSQASPAGPRQPLPGAWQQEPVRRLQAQLARVEAALSLAEGDISRALEHLALAERLAADAGEAGTRLRLLSDQARLLRSLQRPEELPALCDRMILAAEAVVRAPLGKVLDYGEYGRIPSPLWFRTRA